MRSVRSAARLSVFSVALSLAACGGDGDAIGRNQVDDYPAEEGGTEAGADVQSPRQDAGAEPPADTGTSLVPSDGGLPEAAPGDAASDSGPIVLERVTVVDARGTGVEGVPVLVNDAAGDIVLFAHTDSDGVVLADVPEDGALTVFRVRDVVTASGTTVRREISMVLGVPEGHEFHFTVPDPSTVVTVTPMTVDVSVANPPGGATGYMIALLCGEARNVTGTATTFASYVGCEGLNVFDVHAFALDNGGAAIAHARSLDRPFVPGGTDTVTLDGWSTDFDQLAYTAAPLPAGSSSLLVAATGYRAGHFEATARAGLRTEVRRSGLGTEEAAVLRLPAGLFSAFRLAGNVELRASDPRVVSGFDRFLPSLPDAFAFDPSALGVFVDVGEVASGDVSRPVVSWTLADTGRLGDAVRIGVSWSPDAQNTTSFSVTSPASRSGEVTFPVLPAELADYARQAGDEAGTLGGLHIDDLEQSDYAGYLSSSRGDDKNTDSCSAFR